MLPQFFLRTKLLPPRMARTVLPRPRLLEKLRQYLDRSATIVTANAGSGKTTLVAEFLDSSAYNYVWYQIDPSDLDLGVFFGYLTRGVQLKVPQFGAATLSFLRESENAGNKIEQLVDVFLNEIIDHLENRLLIVLDDYHNVDVSEPIARAMDRLLTYLPDVLHLIITSRSLPNLSITRLRSKESLGLIDRQDLLFTPEEAEKFFSELHQQNISLEELNEYYRQTEGWVTGLHLIHQVLDRSQRTEPGAENNQPKPRTEIVLRQSEVEIFDYYAEDVLAEEAPTVQAVLGRLALLERIDPRLCDDLFAAEGGRAILTNAVRRNVFITHLYAGGGDEEYRFHPLFRHFLRHRLETQQGPALMRQLHRQYADYFIRHEAWEEALVHLGRAEDYPALAALLATHGDGLVDTGRYATVKRAFDQLPDEVAETQPRAIRNRAEAALREGDVAAARTLFERTANVAQAVADHCCEAAALHGEASIAWRQLELTQAIELSQTALIKAAECEPILAARCYNTIGLCYLSMGEFETAAQNWQQALSFAEAAGDERFTRIITHNLGLPYWLQGDYDEALRLFGQMLRRTDSAAPFPQEAIGHLNCARVQLVRGAFDSSEAHLVKALERCRIFNLTALQGEVLEALGNLYRETGQYERALQFYNDAMHVYRSINIEIASKELLDERANLHLKMGNLSLARRDIDLVYAARQAAGEAVALANPLLTKGRIELAAGQLAEADQLLGEALTAFRRHSLYYQQVMTETSLARVRFALGQHESAFKHLESATAFSLRFDYSHWLRQEAAAAPELFLAATSSGIYADYLKNLLPETTAPVPPTPPPVITTEVAPSLLADLTVNLLGAVEVIRDPARPFSKDAWKLSKALHILAYIASRRNHRASKDKIIEAFWGEADLEAIEKNFHPTISYMRKALNSEQLVKKNFILFREGAYQLNPEYTYRIDIEEFEQLTRQAGEQAAQGNIAGATEAYEAAVKLYRGDFCEDFYDEWVEELQTYYRDLSFKALKELAAYYQQAGDYQQSIVYSQLILRGDPYREDIHCQIMESYVRLGNRAAAREQYENLKKMLQQELGVEPLPATTSTFQRLIQM